MHSVASVTKKSLPTRQSITARPEKGNVDNRKRLPKNPGEVIYQNDTTVPTYLKGDDAAGNFTLEEAGFGSGQLSTGGVRIPTMEDKIVKLSSSIQTKLDTYTSSTPEVQGLKNTSEESGDGPLHSQTTVPTSIITDIPNIQATGVSQHMQPDIFSHKLPWAETESHNISLQGSIYGQQQAEKGGLKALTPAPEASITNISKEHSQTTSLLTASTGSSIISSSLTESPVNIGGSFISSFSSESSLFHSSLYFSTSSSITGGVTASSAKDDHSSQTLPTHRHLPADLQTFKTSSFIPNSHSISLESTAPSTPSNLEKSTSSFTVDQSLATNSNSYGDASLETTTSAYTEAERGNSLATISSFSTSTQLEAISGLQDNDTKQTTIEPKSASLYSSSNVPKSSEIPTLSNLYGMLFTTPKQSELTLGKNGKVSPTIKTTILPETAASVHPNKDENVKNSTIASRSSILEDLASTPNKLKANMETSTVTSSNLKKKASTASTALKEKSTTRTGVSATSEVAAATTMITSTKQFMQATFKQQNMAFTPAQSLTSDRVSSGASVYFLSSQDNIGKHSSTITLDTGGALESTDKASLPDVGSGDKEPTTKKIKNIFQTDGFSDPAEVAATLTVGKLDAASTVIAITETETLETDTTGNTSIASVLGALDGRKFLFAASKTEPVLTSKQQSSDGTDLMSHKMLSEVEDTLLPSVEESTSLYHFLDKNTESIIVASKAIPTVQASGDVGDITIPNQGVPDSSLTNEHYDLLGGNHLVTKIPSSSVIDNQETVSSRLLVTRAQPPPSTGDHSWASTTGEHLMISMQDSIATDDRVTFSTPALVTTDGSALTTTPASLAIDGNFISTIALFANNDRPLKTISSLTNDGRFLSRTVSLEKDDYPPSMTALLTNDDHFLSTTALLANDDNPPGTAASLTDHDHPPSTTATLVNVDHPASTTALLVKGDHPPSTTASLVNDDQPLSTTALLVNSDHPPSTTALLVNDDQSPSTSASLVNDDHLPSTTASLVHDDGTASTITFLVNNDQPLSTTASLVSDDHLAITTASLTNNDQPPSTTVSLANDGHLSSMTDSLSNNDHSPSAKALSTTDEHPMSNTEAYLPTHNQGLNGELTLSLAKNDRTTKKSSTIKTDSNSLLITSGTPTELAVKLATEDQRFQSSAIVPGSITLSSWSMADKSFAPYTPEVLVSTSLPTQSSGTDAFTAAILESTSLQRPTALVLGGTTDLNKPSLTPATHEDNTAEIFHNKTPVTTSACPESRTGSDASGYISWPTTVDGGSAIGSCPTPTTSDAIRICNSGRWQEPDISACGQLSSTSLQLQDLARSAVIAANASEVAGRILNMTSQGADQLVAYDIANVADILLKVVDVSGTEIDYAISDDVVNVVSNVVEAPGSEMRAASLEFSSNSKLIKVVDDVLLKLEITTDEPVYLDSKNVKAGISSVTGKETFTGTSFSLSSNLQPAISDGQNPFSTSDSTSIQIPASIANGIAPSEFNRIQFTVYTGTELFDYVRVDNGTTPVTRQSSNFTIFSDFVVSASVGDTKIENLKENITITINKSNSYYGNGPYCVFYQFPDDGGEGSWSTDGCHMKESTSTQIVCECDHLTNFAAIMDVYGTVEYLDEYQQMILRILTYIGCSLSIFGLLCTLISYTIFQKIRKEAPAKILICLCTALIAVNVVYLCMQSAYYSSPTTCVAVAAVMHYALLSSLMWMGLEAINMYIALVKVFNTYYRRYMLKMSLVGWGVPLLIVLIAFIVQFATGVPSYTMNSKTEICWLRREVFYGTLVAPFGIVFLLNCVIYCLVLAQLLGMSSRKLKHLDSARKMRKPAKRENARKLRGAVGLMALLGISWGFALGTIDKAALTFAYVFVVFNSSQGFWVFIFHCVLKKEVSKSWKKLLFNKGGDFREGSSRWNRFSSSNTRSTTTTSTRSMSASSIRTSYLVPRSSRSVRRSEASIGMDSKGLDVVIRSNSLGYANEVFDDEDPGLPPPFPPPPVPQEKRIVRRIRRRTDAGPSSTIATQTDVNYLEPRDTDSQVSTEDGSDHSVEEDERRDSVDDNFGIRDGVLHFPPHREVVMSPSNESGIYSDASVSSAAPLADVMRFRRAGNDVTATRRTHDVNGGAMSRTSVSKTDSNNSTASSSGSEESLDRPREKFALYGNRNSRAASFTNDTQTIDSGVSMASDAMTDDSPSTSRSEGGRSQLLTQDSRSSLYSISSNVSSSSALSSETESVVGSNTRERAAPHVWKPPLVIKRGEDPRGDGNNRPKPVLTGKISHRGAAKRGLWKKNRKEAQSLDDAAVESSNLSPARRRTRQKLLTSQSLDEDETSNVATDVKMTDFSLSRGNFYKGAS